MNIFEFTILIWLGLLVTEFPESLTGLGGGVVLIPILVLAFGVDIRYAIGASLVSVIDRKMLSVIIPCDLFLLMENAFLITGKGIW